MIYSDEQIEYIVSQLKSGNAIVALWNIDDVKALNDNLSDNDCRDVLYIVNDTHDANFGITWDTLQEAINNL